MSSTAGSAGFSLIELAVSLTILGLMLAGVIQIGLPLMEQRRQTMTQQNMTRIVNVLSVYAQRNNRIPCPGDPDGSVTAQPHGAEVGSGTTGANVPAVSSPNGCEKSGNPFNEGIVPYRTLGMSQNEVRDAKGQYITYRVNANFARNPTTASTVHGWCRTAEWIPVATNQNPMRARFCCANHDIAGQTIVVNDSNGVTLYPFAPDPTGGNYGAVNTLYAGALAIPANNITAVAFVLVSHGSIGGGAFLDIGTRLPAVGFVGTGETENSDGDVTYVSAQLNTSSTASHYDDTVMWRTQDQVYAETGTGTCALP